MSYNIVSIFIFYFLDVPLEFGLIFDGTSPVDSLLSSIYFQGKSFSTTILSIPCYSELTLEFQYLAMILKGFKLVRKNPTVLFFYPNCFTLGLECINLLLSP